MTTKIAVLVLVSWALVGVENLVNIVSFPGAQGSPLIVNNNHNSKISLVSKSQGQGSQLRGGGGGGKKKGHVISNSQGYALGEQHRRRRQLDDQDYEDDNFIQSSPGLGSIGCKFSRTLCDSDTEWCFDDYAFGRCLKIYEPAEPSKLYRYELSKEETHSLEKEMERLYSLGYRWGHSYTQCVLQKLLDSIRHGTNWEVSSCSDSVDQDLEGAMKAFEDEIDPLNLAFVRFTPSDNNPHADFADELYRPPPSLLETSAPSSAAFDNSNNKLPPSLESELESEVKLYEPAGVGVKLASLAKQKQLKDIPFREQQQFLNSIPQGAEEELLEEAVEDYFARGGQQRRLREDKRAYPYRSSIGLVQQQNNQFEDDLGPIPQDLGGEHGNDNENEYENELTIRRKQTKKAIEREEELQALEFLEALASAADVANAKDGLWQDSPVVSGLQEQGQQRQGNFDSNSINTRAFEQIYDSPLVQPKIFSQLYNTPNLFRNGIETRDSPAVVAAVLEDAAETIVNGNIQDEGKERGEFQLQPERLPVPLPLMDESLVWGGDKTLGFNSQDPDDLLPNNPFDDLKSTNDVETDKPLYTEGGLVYLNNNPKRRFIFDLDPSNSGRSGSEFERRERLDVKKPGPWYRTVNNFGFDYEEKNGHVNPEFAADEGPADMLQASNFQRGFPSYGNNPFSSIPNEDSQQLDPQRTLRAQVAQEQLQSIKAASNSNPFPDKEVSASKKSAPPFIGNAPPVDNIEEHLEVIDTLSGNIVVEKKITYSEARELLNLISELLELRKNPFTEITVKGNYTITFHVEPNEKNLNASQVTEFIQKHKEEILQEKGITIVSASSGINAQGPFAGLMAYDADRYIFVTFFVALMIVSLIIGAVTIYLIRRHAKQHEKIARLSQDDVGGESCKDYQDLCRARMASKNNEKVEPIKAVQRVASTLSRGSDDGTTSSRSEEPVLTNMDISTGHMVLSYMEDHLKNKDRLDQEWSALCGYEADPCSTTIAEKSDNMKKNRFTNSLPYDHSRVILNDLANISGTDYINASTITDHDPRNPAYIATQGPMANTAADFWQMVWEQGSVVIVTLTRLADNGTALCHRYWPEEGSELHHIYEVHLVSEHIWCDEYLVRSFYLKNLKTGETRTVTQFHFQAWPENSIPASTKALLEFRRKVNKSYRGRSCPIIVHCSDGAGRSGTYCLIDMVLNRMAKGAKEIDIAASLEHIRDQRPGMVRTKQQFEFVLMAVAEEVHAILKALPQ